jgi:hypothetical protein
VDWFQYPTQLKKVRKDRFLSQSAEIIFPTSEIIPRPQMATG